MRFLLIIFRQYPGQTLMMLAALVFAGVAEGIGISAMLPLLAITLGSSKTATGGKATQAEQMIQKIFDWLGITPTLEFLILMIFTAMMLKTVLVLFANRRVGYTVARRQPRAVQERRRLLSFR